MDQKNFIIAIVVSVVIIMGWQALFPPAKTPPQQQQQQTTQTASPGTPGGAGNVPGAPPSTGTTPPAEKVLTLDEALAAQGARVTFNTDQVLGSIQLKGARIDDVRLAKQRETIDHNSPPVPVL